MSILLKQRRLQVSWNQWQPSYFESVEAKITRTAKILTEKSAETEINSFWSENDLKCRQLWKSSEIQNWICENIGIIFSLHFSAVTAAHFLMLSDVKFEKPAKLEGYQ